MPYIQICVTDDIKDKMDQVDSLGFEVDWDANAQASFEQVANTLLQLAKVLSSREPPLDGDLL